MSKMYRMFVDEVGHADLRASHDPNQRYLNLTGIIFELEYHDGKVTQLVERLKARHFLPRADGKPLVFHRKELLNGNYPFQALRDPATKEEFDRHLLWLLEHLDYVVISTTIDKLEHLNRYTVWHHHPYHYCQLALLERYAMWLNRRGERGDVYAESRGKREDFLLKKAFRFIYDRGTSQMERSDFQACLLQNDVKLYRKSANIAGLQLADLIAHPSFKVMLAKRNKQAIPSNFGGRIGKILEDSKYDRSRTGRIEGFGRKWLP
jgi:hypothetical protein